MLWIAVILILYFFLKNKSTGEIDSTVSNVAETAIENVTNIFSDSSYAIIKNRFGSTVSGIKNKYKSSLPIEAFLATLKQEAGSYIVNGTPNSKVIGDGGSSIGYSQVSHYAVTDVNQWYGTNFTNDDRYDEYKNLVIGYLFLDLMYRNTNNDSLLIAYKKYNGGADENEYSKNAMASSYADSAFSHYQKFYSLT